MTSRLLKNSSRRHARLAKPSSALRFLAVAMATAAKTFLDLGSARRTCHQNEFFNSLLGKKGRVYPRAFTPRLRQRATRNTQRLIPIPE